MTDNQQAAIEAGADRLLWKFEDLPHGTRGQVAPYVTETHREWAEDIITAAEPHLRKKWAEELERAMFKVESVHHFGFGYHGFKCLCGFESLRNRSRTEHITQAVRNLLEGAGE